MLFRCGICGDLYKRRNRFTNGCSPFCRFLSMVDQSAGEFGCWTWTGNRNTHGYGVFAPARSKAIGAHRYAYLIAIGPLVDGLLVCHHCDNPPCVNPRHLFGGDKVTNAEDMVRKGRNRPLRGVTNPFAKLQDDDVVMIRNARANGVSRQSLAEHYRVDPATISHITSRKKWKHVL